MADNEKLTPDLAIRILRAKAAELEARAKMGWEVDPMYAAHDADIALIAELLADHIERPGHVSTERIERSGKDERTLYQRKQDEIKAREAGLTAVEVQHDASFNPLGVQLPGESPISEWHAGDPPGPGQPGDASDAT